jgi:uncharacterized protein with HEPN domain
MRSDDAYLLDMKLAGEKALLFARGATRERLSSDEMLQFAVVHAVQIIGEAARHVSPVFRDAHPEIPWVAISTMRHRLVHEYMKVDLDIVWNVLHQHVPDLIRLLEPLIPKTPPKPEGGQS